MSPHPPQGRGSQWGSCDDPQDHGLALAAATAQAGGPQATAPTGQLMGQSEGDARTGHSDRVAQGDSAAIHVHDFVGHPESIRRRQGHSGERLVDLQQV